MRALIWDVDGTLAETERDGHRVAFNQAFETLGLPWYWSEPRYGELLDVTGGYERLLQDMDSQPQAPTEQADREVLARRLHRIKNEAYARIVVEGGIALRAGVRELMDECTAAGVLMAIATTTSRSNVDALLGAHLGPTWQKRFACVMCGEDAPRKKPDPQVYQMTLQALDMTAADVLAIEDSPIGVRACVAAGVPAVVTRSVYFEAQSFAGALAVGPGLGCTFGWRPVAPRPQAQVIDLTTLRAWHRVAGR